MAERLMADPPPTPIQASVCLTPGCVRTAATVLDLIDANVDPCDDFYAFACGSFVRNTPIPDDKPSVNIFSEILDKLQFQIRKLIVEPVNEELESRPVRIAKQWFQACLDEKRIAELGVGPTIELSQRFGGWPVLVQDAWDADGTWSWSDTLVQFRQSGLDTAYIFILSVQTDLFDSSVRTLDLDQTALGADREYLVEGLDDPIVQAYYKYMVDVAVELGADRELAEPELKAALEFEIELAKLGLPNEERRNATALHNPMRVHEIQTAYPYLDWLSWLNAVIAPVDLRIDDDESIVVTVPVFFAGLGDLLAKTPKRTLANYLVWRAVEQTVPYGPDRLRDRLQEFERAQSGQEEKPPRWQECIDATNEKLPISLAALYVRKYFRESSKMAAVDMVRNIRAEFEHILNDIAWMDEPTRTDAIRKLHAMQAHIAYPNELGDDKLLSAYYDDLSIASDRYLDSALRVNLFDANNEFRQLRERVNKTDWRRHANVASLNALYRPTENSIMFPAGILQGRFFDAQRPAYMNYGAIGLVIGHEITHGFDDKGRQFNAAGNVEEWWPETTLDRFLERADCIIEQFGNYTEQTTNLTLNGVRTQGENIADSGGVKIAYNAYRRWTQANGAEQQLPALSYTPDQLFWISAAQNWCSVQKTETVRLTIMTDHHVPSEFRVLGPMHNSAEFARDFACAAGTPMNPVDKCGVW